MICRILLADMKTGISVRRISIACFILAKGEFLRSGFYCFSSERYFVKTDGTGIQNHEWKTSLAAVLFSFT